MLYDDIMGFADGMRDVDRNTRVEVCEAPHAPHDVFLVENLMGWTKEAEVSAQAASRFLQGLKSAWLMYVKMGKDLAECSMQGTSEGTCPD